MGHAPLRAHADRVLIGACDPMLCPIWGFRNGGRGPAVTTRVAWNATAVLFTVAFPDGATGTANPNGSATITEFPAWQQGAGLLPKLGSLSWSATFLAGLDIGVGAPAGGYDHESPTVLFTAFNGTAAVFSAASEFMTVQHTRTAVGAWHYGVGSEVTELPSGFSYQSVFVVSGAGISAAIDAWGEVMQRKYSAGARKIADVTATKLGYMTDRGVWSPWEPPTQPLILVLPTAPVWVNCATIHIAAPNPRGVSPHRLACVARFAGVVPGLHRPWRCRHITTISRAARRRSSDPGSHSARSRS